MTETEDKTNPPEHKDDIIIPIKQKNKNENKICFPFNRWQKIKKIKLDVIKLDVII